MSFVTTFTKKEKKNFIFHGLFRLWNCKQGIMGPDFPWSLGPNLALSLSFSTFMSIPYYAFKEAPLKYRCDHVSEKIERSEVDRNRDHGGRRGSMRG